MQYFFTNTIKKKEKGKKMGQITQKKKSNSSEKYLLVPKILLRLKLCANEREKRRHHERQYKNLA